MLCSSDYHSLHQVCVWGGGVFVFIMHYRINNGKRGKRNKDFCFKRLVVALSPVSSVSDLCTRLSVNTSYCCMYLNVALWWLVTEQHPCTQYCSQYKFPLLCGLIMRVSGCLCCKVICASVKRLEDSHCTRAGHMETITESLLCAILTSRLLVWSLIM